MNSNQSGMYWELATIYVLNPEGFYGPKTYPDVVSKSGSEMSLKFNPHTRNN